MAVLGSARVAALCLSLLAQVAVLVTTVRDALADARVRQHNRAAGLSATVALNSVIFYM
jgi:hypothetical protein